MFKCVCFGACVTVRRCLLAFIVCCVFPVFFLLVCVCKGSVAVFSFVCTYIWIFKTIIYYLVVFFGSARRFMDVLFGSFLFEPICQEVTCVCH